MDALLKGIHRQGRDNVRTPMHWDKSSHAGFTTAEEPWIKLNPNYPVINATVALADPCSIYYYYLSMLAFRKAHKTFVYGAYEPIEVTEKQVFAYRRTDDTAEFLVVLNFSGTMSKAFVDLPSEEAQWQYTLGNYAAMAPTFAPLAPWEARILRKNKH